MDFKDKNLNTIKIKNDSFIRNPPILKGIETRFKENSVEIKNIDGPFKKNMIVTKVIKTENDNNYFKMNKENRKNIRSPPNFF